MSQQFHQQNMSSSGHSDGRLNDFMQNQFAPGMIDYGINEIKRKTVTLMPGVSKFWSSLKMYFAVSNSYVLKKIFIVLYPIKNQSWGRALADEGEETDAEAVAYTSHKWALPKQDINAPDLYIPLMSFITYVLLVGFRKGLGKGFTPEVLIQSVWRCLILQVIETFVIKFGLSLMQAPIPILDIFAYTGYKYVGLCLNTLARGLGTTFGFITALYTCAALAYFILKAMAAVVPAAISTGPPRHLMLLGFATIQFLVPFVLSSL